MKSLLVLSSTSCGHDPLLPGNVYVANSVLENLCFEVILTYIAIGSIIYI